MPKTITGFQNSITKELYLSTQVLCAGLEIVEGGGRVVFQQEVGGVKPLRSNITRSYKRRQWIVYIKQQIWI